MASLSKRGRACITQPSSYHKRKMEGYHNMYHADTNPSGHIALHVAENMLSVAAIAQAIAAVPPTPASQLTYGSSLQFRTAIARFLSTHVTHTPVVNTNLVLFNGATSIIDAIAYVLCNPGDAVLTVGPGYRGLQEDVEGRSEARLIVASLDEGDHDAPPLVTVASFEKAWQEAGAEHSRIRMLIVVSPHNPTGQVLSKDLILDIVHWSRERKLHLVFDEVYAKSVHSDTVTFVSVAEALEGNLGDDVHIIYSFSKDMCLAGTRLGVLYTHNADIHESLESCLLSFGSTSRHTQWAVQHILSNEQWVKHFLESSKARLKDAYEKVECKLDELGIPYMAAEAGFFVWIDLRKWMDGSTSDDEMALWLKLMDAGVGMTPASQCFGKRYGFFRMCFAAASEDMMAVVWERLGGALASCNRN